jgi:hypothetical protein
VLATSCGRRYCCVAALELVLCEENRNGGKAEEEKTTTESQRGSISLEETAQGAGVEQRLALLRFDDPRSTPLQSPTLGPSQAIRVGPLRFYATVSRLRSRFPLDRTQNLHRSTANS